jgi:hypothetical protein
MWKVFTRLTCASDFLLSTYEIWKVLISLAKMSQERKKKFRLSRGIAVGFWTNFEAQLAQPC